jgi:hypothetical protein
VNPSIAHCPRPRVIPMSKPFDPREQSVRPDPVAVDPAGRALFRIQTTPIPPSEMALDERLKCGHYLRGVIRRYGLANVLWNLQVECAAEGMDIIVQTIDDMAQCEEQP